jgi:hypothetical protein
VIVSQAVGGMRTQSHSRRYHLSSTKVITSGILFDSVGTTESSMRTNRVRLRGLTSVVSRILRPTYLDKVGSVTQGLSSALRAHVLLLEDLAGLAARFEQRLSSCVTIVFAGDASLPKIDSALKSRSANMPKTSSRSAYLSIDVLCGTATAFVPLLALSSDQNSWAKAPDQVRASRFLIDGGDKIFGERRRS